MTTLNSILLAAAGTGAVTAAYVMARRVYDDWTVRAFERRTFNAKLDAFRQRSALNAIRHLPADERGRGGWMVQPDGAMVNLDTYAQLNSGWRVTYIDPLRERMDHLERLLLSGAGNGGNDVLQLAPEPEPMIPTFVPIERVMDGAPSYRRLVLGRGEHETVTADLADLVHVAIGGTIGWGKSVFLRWLVYQLIRSTDPVKLALIDMENATLAPFAHSDRVLWPLADNEMDAASILAELRGELDRRKELYRKFEDLGIDSMYAYNEVAAEPLEPIVTAIDEATALLSNKAIEADLRMLILRARKYGLWFMLAGQDWKASSLDTAIRNHLGGRFQFRTMDATQSRVLIHQAGAEELPVKGRAIAVLPGRDPITFQAPLLRGSEMCVIRGNGPLHEMPQAVEHRSKADDPKSSENVARVLELRDEGWPQYKIEEDVYGYRGGRAHQHVSEIIADNSTTTE